MLMITRLFRRKTGAGRSQETSHSNAADCRHKSSLRRPQGSVACRYTNIPPGGSKCHLLLTTDSRPRRWTRRRHAFRRGFNRRPFRGTLDHAWTTAGPASARPLTTEKPPARRHPPSLSCCPPSTPPVTTPPRCQLKVTSHQLTQTINWFTLFPVNHKRVSKLLYVCSPRSLGSLSPASPSRLRAALGF
jgi:hypothetical protein